MTRKTFGTVALALLLSALGGVVPARAQVTIPGRQVTIFGVLATPGGGVVDPKLKPISAQLQKLLPNHSFKLIKLESRRITASQSVPCDLGEGFTTEAQLLSPLDLNGKVQMQLDLSFQGVSQYRTIVVTPPDQIFFVDKVLGNGSRLIIGLGAR